jgi:uncharacterized protein
MPPSAELEGFSTIRPARSGDISPSGAISSTVAAEEDLMNPRAIIRGLCGALVAAVLAASAAWTAERTGESRVPYLRVTGSGTASSAPDRAEVDVGVMTEAATAEKAAEDNARRQSAVIEAIRKALGPKAEVRTLAYSVSPRYQYPRDGEPVLAGYQASNTVRVRTDDLGRVGEVLDAATKAGANQIHGVRFSLQDESALRAEALRDAVKRARDQAEAIAGAMGLRIVAVRSVEASPAHVPIVPVRALAARAEAMAPPIEEGTIELSTEVTITFDVAP